MTTKRTIYIDGSAGRHSPAAAAGRFAGTGDVGSLRRGSAVRLAEAPPQSVIELNGSGQWTAIRPLPSAS